MKHLKSYKEISEALLPSQFRKYVKSFDRERYEDIFKTAKEKYSGDRNAFRIYLPLLGAKSGHQTEIEVFLNENGYEILDYIKGQCKFKSAKNPSKIGQVLTKLKSDDLMKKFVEDPQRKAGSNLLVCISRHPYDIAGADTDRGWTNCMTIGTKSSKRIDELNKEIAKLKSKREADEDDWDSDLEDEITFIKDKIADIKKSGVNAKYLLQDVKAGSLISYLIKEGDKNINSPIANLNIKPYVNMTDKGDFVLVSDSRMYGNGTEEFKNTVDAWLEEVNDIKEGLYELSSKVYDDTYEGDEKIVSIGDGVRIINNIIDNKKLTLEILTYIIKYIKSNPESVENLNIKDLLLKITPKLLIEGIAYELMDTLFELSVKYNNIKFVKMMMDKLTVRYDSIRKVFIEAIDNNNMELVKILSNDDSDDIIKVIINTEHFSDLAKYIEYMKYPYKLSRKGAGSYSLKVNSTIFNLSSNEYSKIKNIKFFKN